MTLLTWTIALHHICDSWHNSNGIKPHNLSLLIHYHTKFFPKQSPMRETGKGACLRLTAGGQRLISALGPWSRLIRPWSQQPLTSSTASRVPLSVLKQNSKSHDTDRVWQSHHFFSVSSLSSSIHSDRSRLDRKWRTWPRAWRTACSKIQQGSGRLLCMENNHRTKTSLHVVGGDASLACWVSGEGEVAVDLPESPFPIVSRDFCSQPAS